MHAAGILGNIATDAAGDLGRGVWCVVEAVRFGRLADREVAHTGLDTCATVVRVDRDDPVEAREAEKDAILVRQGSTGQSGPGATGDHCDPLLVTDTQHRLNLFDAAGQYDQQWHDPVCGQHFRDQGRPHHLNQRKKREIPGDRPRLHPLLTCSGPCGKFGNPQPVHGPGWQGARAQDRTLPIPASVTRSTWLVGRPGGS